jgi:hypothetical protein
MSRASASVSPVPTQPQRQIAAKYGSNGFPRPFDRTSLIVTWWERRGACRPRSLTGQVCTIHKK